MRANYGSAIGGGAPAWLRTGFPNLLRGFSSLHALSRRSFTPHPGYAMGAPNKRITHAQYYRLRKGLVSAFDELALRLPL
jgi:hypothetical protein